MGPALLLLALSPAHATELCPEESALCLCLEGLGHVVDGEVPEPGIYFNGHGRAVNELVAAFESGGSPTAALACQAGRYAVGDDPQWLEAFYEHQLQPGGPGILGHESMSPEHGPAAAAVSMAVLRQARLAGHGTLAYDTQQWLRAWWGASALGAMEGAVEAEVLVGPASETIVPGDAEVYDGVSAVLVGTDTPRRSRQGSALLSLALGWEPVIDTRNTSGPALQVGSLRVAAHVLGLQIGGDGVVVPSEPVEAYAFGLSRAERDDLRLYVRSGGNQGLDGVLPMLSHAEPGLPVTWLRTTDGVAVWLPEGAEGVGTMGAVLDEDGTQWSLANTDIPAGKIDTGLCAGEVCVALPTGDVLHEVTWGASAPATAYAYPGPPASSWPVPEAAPSEAGPSPVAVSRGCVHAAPAPAGGVLAGLISLLGWRRASRPRAGRGVR